MANRDKTTSNRNHIRQLKYLAQGIVMLPTRREERLSVGKKNK